nr:carbohydrate sulfotransferase 1-like [Lytechinus pictus]
MNTTKSVSFRSFLSLIFVVCLLIVLYIFLFETGKYPVLQRHRETESRRLFSIYATNQSQPVSESNINSSDDDWLNEILQTMSENEDYSSKGAWLKTTESPTQTTSKPYQIDRRQYHKPIFVPASKEVKMHDTLTGNTSRVQVVILTSKRSGSSFLGELFNANPYVFYVYEPLYVPMEDVYTHNLAGDWFTRIADDVWNHTLRCNFSTKYPPDHSWLKRGDASFDSCKSNAAIKRSSLLCPVLRIPLQKIGPVVSGLCHDRPYTVLKTIRVQSILELKKFIEDPGLNIKILHLVRDPRAVMSSRWNLKESNKDLFRRKGPGADEVLDLCDHMQQNVALGSSTPDWLKDRYIRVRMEDIAQDPIGETKRLYDKLGMRLHDDVLSWIKENTHGSTDGSETFNPYSRTRDTKKVVNTWKSKLSVPSIQRIESSCWKLMNALSYERFSLKDRTIYKKPEKKANGLNIQRSSDVIRSRKKFPPERHKLSRFQRNQYIGKPNNTHRQTQLQLTQQDRV